MIELSELPTLVTKNVVLFPAMRCVVHLGNARAFSAIEAALRRPGGQVAVLACSAEPPFDACSIGTVARILNFGRQSCCQRWVADLEGQARVRVDSWLPEKPFREARCTRLVNSVTDPSLHELVSAIHAEARRLRDLFPACVHARRAVERLTKRGGPGHLPGAVGDLLLHLSMAERQRLLELEPLGARLEATLASLHTRPSRSSAPEWLH